MTAGFYKMRRGWQDNPALREPYNKCGAWIWLIEHAAWKPTKINIKGKTVQIERGQLCFTTRQMAAAWQWPETGVRRFLTRLKTDAMIGAETGAGKTLLTICNYKQYQDIETSGGAESGAESGAEVAQKWRTKEEGKEGKKSNQQESPSKKETPPTEGQRKKDPPPNPGIPANWQRPPETLKPIKKAPYPSDFTEFWDAYPKRLNASKKAAFEAWGRLLKAGEQPKEIVDGARLYAVQCEAAGTPGQFITHAATWLNQARHHGFNGETTASVIEKARRESGDNGGGKRSDSSFADEATMRFVAGGD